MGDRQELVREAFAALDSGDITPFRDLLAPDAKWVAIPQGADVAETPTCATGAAIVDRLKARFPLIAGPHKDDICYATTNRQEAVTRVAPIVDALIVVGAPNSSNSQRLKEVAERAGCPHAALVQRAADIDWNEFGAITRLGITAGASAPEVLVEEIIDAFAQRYEISVETVSATEEGVFFPLPRPLRESQAAE